MKYILYILLVIVSKYSYAYNYTINEKVHIDITGYIGWKQIESFQSFSHLKSEPELGFIGNVSLYDDVVLYNQFQYGTQIDEILVYNFIKYSPNIFNEIDMHFYGGKIRLDYGLYNASRINPRSRTGVIEPQSIYWSALKQPLTSGLGIGAEFRYNDFIFKYSITKSVIQNPSEEALIWTDGLLNKLNSNFGDQLFAAFEYSPNNKPLLLKWSYLYLNFGDDLSQLGINTYPELIGKDVNSQLNTFGISYDYENFNMYGELLLVKSPVSNWFDLNELSYGYSFGLTYNASDYVSLYTNYNEYNSELDQRFLKNNNLPKYLGFYKDLSIGVNVHDSNWLLGVEAHYINGSRTIPKNNISNFSDFEQYWMVGANLVYYFN